MQIDIVIPPFKQQLFAENSFRSFKWKFLLITTPTFGGITLRLAS